MLGQMGETTKLDLAEFTGHACRVIFVGALGSFTTEPWLGSWVGVFNKFGPDEESEPPEACPPGGGGGF